MCANLFASSAANPAFDRDLSAGVREGVRAFRPWTLALYDFTVMRVLFRNAWGCDPARILAFYRRNLGPNHADVGVGTGYFLDHCDLPVASQRIALYDLNRNCLAHASARLARHVPEVHVQNALQDFPVPAYGFDSLSMGALLHCLPGSMAEKCRVFDAIQPVLLPHARVFGYTLCGTVGGAPLAARPALALLNRLGIMHNREDSMAALAHELGRRFRRHSVQQIGGVILFAADNGEGSWTT